MISVILCTYNRDKYIYNVLKSVAENDYPHDQYEIVLVNNNSTDGTENECRRFQADYPDIRFRYFLETNQGLSYARNCGIRNAQGDLLAYVDDDATVNPEYLRTYSDFFTHHPEAVAAGGPILPVYETEEPEWMTHYTRQLITGKLETPYTEKHPSNISKYNLLIAAEIGYEWRLNQHALGVQLFAEAAVWSKQTPNPLTPNPLIQVQPITSAENPVPFVTVGSAESFVSGRRYIGVGVRAYYAFHIEHIRLRQFKPRGDSRDHRNRYLWW